MYGGSLEHYAFSPLKSFFCLKPIKCYIRYYHEVPGWGFIDGIKLVVDKNIRDGFAVGDNVGDSVVDNVGDCVVDNVGDCVVDNAGDCVVDNVVENVGDNVVDNVVDCIVEV